MPYITPVAGTTITASWGAVVRDQLVTPFASQAARTSAIVTPLQGMLSHVADFDRFEGRFGGSVGWRELLDYRNGKGLVYGKHKADGVTMANAVSAETTIFTKTVTGLEVGRSYELVARAGWTASVSNGTAILRIKENATQLASSGEQDAPTTPFTAVSMCSTVYVATATSATFNITVAPLNGGGTRTVIAYTTDPFAFTVRDITGTAGLIEA